MSYFMRLYTSRSPAWSTSTTTSRPLKWATDSNSIERTSHSGIKEGSSYRMLSWPEPVRFVIKSLLEEIWIYCSCQLQCSSCFCLHCQVARREVHMPVTLLNRRPSPINIYSIIVAIVVFVVVLIIISIIVWKSKSAKWWVLCFTWSSSIHNFY